MSHPAWYNILKICCFITEDHMFPEQLYKNCRSCTIKFCSYWIDRCLWGPEIHGKTSFYTKEIMVNVWCTGGVIHTSFCTSCGTVRDAEKYRTQIDKIKLRVMRSRLVKLKEDILLCNGRPHVSWTIIQKLHSLYFETLSSPYIPQTFISRL